MTPEEMADAIGDDQRRLFEAREKRIKPGRDEKILAAWNGMMIARFAEGYRALGDARYLEAAERAVEFVMTKLWDGHALRRSYKDGVARFNAYLEDYALIASAMIDVYEASLDPQYLEHARTLADVILERFLDKRERRLFLHLGRPRAADHAIQGRFRRIDAVGQQRGGDGVAAASWLHRRRALFDEAQRAIKLFREFIEKQPFAFSHMLEAVDLYLRGPVEIVMVGDRSSPEFREWIERSGCSTCRTSRFTPSMRKIPPRDSVPEQAREKIRSTEN